MSERPERTALYRYYDAANVLLYIGISNRPEFRAKAHLYENRRGDWPKRAVRRVDEWYASRPLALAADEAAIRAEKPLYNGTHNYDDVTFDPASWPKVAESPKAPRIANLMRREIFSGRWPAGARIPPLRVLAEPAGVTVQPVGRAVALLKAEGLLTFSAGRGLFVAARPKLPHDWPRRCGFPG
ncbi:winged helix-turn-helix domain-containing protein [Streptomyces sp. Ac-502]|uniref:winged helix-turn-helix domain-containing protein n=1 Tax=Streptomyces sp. Ac-502 TaxID=3342801 RepID=UPI0038626F7C